MKKSSYLIIFSFVLLFSLVIMYIIITNNDLDQDGYQNEIDSFPQNPHEWIDSDHDGYGDNSDDFPLDATLHKKCCVSNNQKQTLSAKESYYPKNCERFCIDCQCKYVIIDWSIETQLSQTEKENIFIHINYPTLSVRRNYHHFTSKDINHTLRCPICHIDDIGDWNIYFYNDLTDSNILMNYDIYRAK